MASCRVCGRTLDDLGTCVCVSRADTRPLEKIELPKPPVAVTLRRMAATYKDLAEQADRAGRHAEAASFWRMNGELLQAATETEAKLLAYYVPPEPEEEPS